MINIHLLVDEDYIEELMMTLPKDKVRVVEKDFEENKLLLKNVFDECSQGSPKLTSYKDSVEIMNTWLEEKK